MDPIKIFAPSIETGSKENSPAFLTEHPYDILKNGKAHKVPLLTGVNSHEGLLATASNTFNNIFPSLANMIMVQIKTNN